ncbi:hypothetical protein EMPS_07067 [Entomortierella parvispora]|uniref:Uncharacterized protein n=1 Tax=Entomortierella parvispora TaxID=205924 RepID=A0A9P3LXZ8_9FUNG|nr:hypothetical protein EMPS_07067 [Entomortierella parvispora]
MTKMASKKTNRAEVRRRVSVMMLLANLIKISRERREDRVAPRVRDDFVLIPQVLLREPRKQHKPHEHHEHHELHEPRAPHKPYKRQDSYSHQLWPTKELPMVLVLPIWPNLYPLSWRHRLFLRLLRLRTLEDQRNSTLEKIRRHPSLEKNRHDSMLERI